VLGGVLAGAIFKRLWKLTARQDEAPEAGDAGRGRRKILIAAAVQGAVFGLVKAAVDRSAAEGTRKLTGTWPATETPPAGRGRLDDRSWHRSPIATEEK
jgi:hypothetical protein